MSERWGSRVLQELARKQLAILGGMTGVQSAVLFSADGFEVASHAVSAEAAGRLAAIGSSLSSLGSAISAEAGLRVAERTIVESANGTVMIMQVPATPAMSLAVVADRSALLGRLLWASKHCCQVLADAMGT
ncbi:roadblock/LC7 domain-containing protein [Dyella sp.]|uniref:roadblock/LC7 domain-containing protein n=1 Tax=Dyella sp. TaxID=1869338 RepID=UPI002ED02B1C